MGATCTRAKEDAARELPAINKEMEAVKLAQTRLASVFPNVFDVSDQMVRLINAETESRKDVLLSTVRTMNGGQLYHELVHGLVSLYKVPAAFSAIEIKENANCCIDEILTECVGKAKASGSEFSFMELGARLSQVPLGGEIVQRAAQ
eukprot:SAG11_NODE_20587_length_442_cov_0.903790_1_plen_147_part_11